MNNVLRTFFFKTKKEEDPLTMVTIAQNQYALKYGSRSRTSRIDKRMQFAQVDLKNLRIDNNHFY